MASAFTHAFFATGLATLADERLPRRRLALVLVVLSVAPDLDVVGYKLGVPYGHALGHRGLSHSLAFALGCGGLAPWAFPELPRFSRDWWRVAGLASLATASHGLLDAFTDGGLGVAFLLPFDGERFFFAWRPLLTSPLSLERFFSARGAAILWNEARWVWLPLAALLLAVHGGRALRSSRSKPRAPTR